MGARPPFKTGESYNTQLSPLDEMAFRQWVKQNGIPFDPNAASSDYDMRGFYQGMQNQNPMARSAVNETDGKLHYSDYYKTPSHQSFSRESQWADPNTPQWINGSQLAAPNGRIVFDETPKPDSPFRRGGAVMPLTKSASPTAFKSNIKAEMASGRPQKQALAIAFRVQRDAKRKKMAKGGRVKGYAPGGVASPPFTVRSEARDLQRAGAGMINSPVAGRTDRLPMGVKPSSYIVPADVVSGLGQGNSSAGANALSRMFKMGPYGSGMAKPPGARRGFADGGDVAAPGDAPTVPIMAAGGEFVVDPATVASIGGGDIEKGHAILDSMVAQTRKKTIKTLRKLPKPRQR